jgi:hypothetical protein
MTDPNPIYTELVAEQEAAGTAEAEVTEDAQQGDR